MAVVSLAVPQGGGGKEFHEGNSMKSWQIFTLALGMAALPAASQAHFRLLAPASWIEENQLGDPQKAAPCGGTNADFGKPTYAVTDARGGSSLHVKVQETVYHPGHYRIALAVNSPTELPVDPKAETITDDKGAVRSVSGAIMNPVAAPVLADGLFQHDAKTADAFETDVTLPNISCRSCTLQVIQFMEKHGVNNPGQFSYHHCAVLHITADPAKPIDAAWPKERVR
jgi:hypothetical protein